MEIYLLIGKYYGLCIVGLWYFLLFAGLTLFVTMTAIKCVNDTKYYEINKIFKKTYSFDFEDYSLVEVVFGLFMLSAISLLFSIIFVSVWEYLWLPSTVCCVLWYRTLNYIKGSN